MIETTIGDILDGNEPETSGHCIYVVRDRDTVLYVGKSERNVTDRIRRHLGVFYETALGRLIQDNLPESRDWLVELLTLNNCAGFVRQVFPEYEFWDTKRGQSKP